MITIAFDFHHYREENLQQLNKLLQTMELTDLSIADSEGYLATPTAPESSLPHRYCGLGSGILYCKLAKNHAGFHYQIDTYVADRTIDRKAYLDTWQQQHPDRVLHIPMVLGFPDALALVIIHREKVVAQNE